MHLYLGALILILVGVIFLSTNLDAMPVEQLKTLPAAWWPLALILVDLAAIMRPRRAD